jgi:uncharacterized membrane protein YvlD (DUF360 family)
MDDSERFWDPARLGLHPLRLLVSWALSAVALMVAAAILPGVHVSTFLGAIITVAIIAVLNALLPPIIAALRLPYMLALGFILVLVADAFMLVIASNLDSRAVQVDSFGWALLAALLMSAVTLVFQVVVGTNENDEYNLRLARRIARREGIIARTDTPGIIFLEIDGLGLPVLQRAMRAGNAPNMARWLTGGSYTLAEWETDLSSQTGASQAGILLGSNADIPAFRWVEKETGTVMSCSAPNDCAEIEQRHASGKGLLVDGGASRGNLLSGEADEAILTVSRMAAEKRANPGYRAFFANGTNVTRTLVLYFWEVGLEWMAAARAKRRDVWPRGHRGGKYPFLRAAMCVAVRDLIVNSVLTDMMRGRPVVYATFSSYDEVAHHSGLERADTLEALRKLDQQFGRLDRARRYTPRPYEIVVLSDHGQTQGATFKQRNGYGLDELVRRSVATGNVGRIQGGDENESAVGHAVDEATGQTQKKESKRPASDVSEQDIVVLGSGNLGLIYLMDEKRRLTLEDMRERHPDLIPALCEHPHVGWVLVDSSEHGPLALGARGVHYLNDDRVEGEDPLSPFSPNAARHLLRTSGFPHVADIMVNSFYDHQLEEGCAFEELISFHGGMGGPQTRPFILYPKTLALPDHPIVGAAEVHDILAGWRHTLEGTAPEPAQPAPTEQPSAVEPQIAG